MLSELSWLASGMWRRWDCMSMTWLDDGRLAALDAAPGLEAAGAM